MREPDAARVYAGRNTRMRMWGRNDGVAVVQRDGHWLRNVHDVRRRGRGANARLRAKRIALMRLPEWQNRRADVQRNGHRFLPVYGLRSCCAMWRRAVQRKRNLLLVRDGLRHVHGALR